MLIRRTTDALVLSGTAILLSACGESVLSPTNRFRIEPIAVVEGGIAQWDPNDEPTLYLHAIGIADEETDRVTWTQSGLSLADTLAFGPMLALNAGGKGCGYGGVTFTITASLPGRNDEETIAVNMERYLCAGSPWVTP